VQTVRLTSGELLDHLNIARFADSALGENFQNKLAESVVRKWYGAHTEADSLVRRGKPELLSRLAGADLLFGGGFRPDGSFLPNSGADTLEGGDVFVFNKGDSYDTVWDFNAAEGDKVRIDPALAGSFTEFQSRLSGFTFEGADFTVFLSADGSRPTHHEGHRAHGLDG